jgi:hypothetical protein
MSPVMIDARGRGKVISNSILPIMAAERHVSGDGIAGFMCCVQCHECLLDFWEPAVAALCRLMPGFLCRANPLAAIFSRFLFFLKSLLDGLRYVCTVTGGC